MAHNLDENTKNGQPAPEPMPDGKTTPWSENSADKPAGGTLEKMTPVAVPSVRDGGSGDGEISVDSEVLTRFAKAADEWQKHVQDAKGLLDAINVRPTGTEAFTEGANIQRLVNGDGLRGQYSKNLASLVDAFAALSTGLVELRKKYDDTEMLNGKGADKLGELLNGAGRYLPGSPTPPPPPSSPPPGSKGQ